MNRSAISYRILQLDEPINLGEGRQYAKSAIIEKWINRTKISSKKLGFPSNETIFQLIDENAILDISHCYLKDFSLQEYRKSRGLKEDQLINIQSLNAEECFFESESCTDFSYAHFQGESANLEHSIFHLGRVNFEFCKCESEIRFSHSNFQVEEINFRFSEFDKGDVHFSHAVIDTLDLVFVNSNFGLGNVYFKQVDFVSSNINFQYCSFQKGSINFDRSSFGGNDIDLEKLSSEPEELILEE